MQLSCEAQADYTPPQYDPPPSHKEDGVALLGGWMKPNVAQRVEAYNSTSVPGGSDRTQVSSAMHVRMAISSSSHREEKE